MLLSSANCQLKVTDVPVSTQAEQEPLTTCMDGVRLAMTGNYEMNLIRRKAIRP